jgi:hypothetical protein
MRGQIANKIRDLIRIPERLTEIHQSIERQGEAALAAIERHEQQRDVQPPWLDSLVNRYDQAERNKTTGEDRQYRVQRSIKTAAWLTFGAATFYALITVLLWLNARNQLEMEHRSWLVFDPNYSDAMQLGADNTDVSVPFRLVNIGKTPARTIDGFVIVEELKKGEHPTFIYHSDRATPIRSGMLYPGSEYAQTTAINEFTDDHKSVAVSDMKRKEFKEGTVIFNAWGRLAYFDVFQQPHWVQFCHAIAQSPSAKTKECVNYNLVDTPSTYPSFKTLLRR